MNLKTITCLAALALAGCMTSPQGTLTSVEYTCAASTAALKTIIVFNDKLTAQNRADVTKAVAIINPICAQDNPPTLTSTASAALAGALTQITSVAATASK